MEVGVGGVVHNVGESLFGKLVNESLPVKQHSQWCCVLLDNFRENFRQYFNGVEERGDLGDLWD